MENIKEELYKWYPIVDEGEYWTDYDMGFCGDEIPKIATIVTNGEFIWTYSESPFGWGTMAKLGDYKYMRIKMPK